MRFFLEVIIIVIVIAKKNGQLHISGFVGKFKAVTIGQDANIWILECRQIAKFKEKLIERRKKLIG